MLICQALSWVGESWASRCLSSQLTQKAKMKVTLKSLITYHNSIGKKLNQRKCQPPSCSISPHWVVLSEDHVDRHRLVVVSGARGAKTKGSHSFTELGWNEGTQICLRAWPARGFWILGCNSFSPAMCCCAPSLAWRGQLSPGGMPGRAFVITFGWAWKITHRFLARNWTPHLALLNISITIHHPLPSTSTPKIGQCWSNYSTLFSRT